MEEKKTVSDNFTEGSIPRKLIKFMLPVLGALILQAMYGAVDLLIVGRFGSDAGISAVATGSNIIHMATLVISSLTMGVTVLIGRYLGEERQDRVGKVIGGGVFLFLVLSVILATILVLGAPFFSGLLNAPEEALNLTVIYVRICGGGIVFVVAYNVISGIFRGLGNSRLPLLFVAIACLTNIVGDYLFIAVLHMDVAGAALATILAQAVSVILSLAVISKQNLPFSFSFKDVGWNSEIGRFVCLGAPLAFQDILTSISFLIVCAIINHMGLDASSGYGIAQKLISFVMLLPSSLMQSLSAFVAQNVGAGKEKRAKLAMKTGMAIGAGIGVFITILTFLYGDIPSALFTENADYIAKSWEYLKGFSSEAVLTCFVFGYIGYFNGHGKTLPVMLQGITASFLVRVPLSYMLSLTADGNLTRIGIAVPLASVYGIVFFSICYFMNSGRKKDS